MVMQSLISDSNSKALEVVGQTIKHSAVVYGNDTQRPARAHHLTNLVQKPVGVAYVFNNHDTHDGMEFLGWLETKEIALKKDYSLFVLVISDIDAE